VSDAQRPSITWFDPQPGADELPARMPSPFATEPHPIARRAVEGLVSRLPIDSEGKMFGVLVVRAPDGRIGYSCAFSGMLGGRWHVDGFAPPVFDARERDAFWPAGEAELARLEARRRALDSSAALAELADTRARHKRESTALRDQHRIKRDNRHVERARTRDADAIHALDEQSRADGRMRRQLDAAHRDELALLIARLGVCEAELAAIDEQRAARSRELLHAIQDTYVIANARGERRGLRELFDGGAPPGGAADCAAPKLLAHAFRHGLHPIALAEVWWGPSPASGGRLSNVCYPACRGKCGPVLAHMLDGLDVDVAPTFGADAVGADEPRVVFEDAWLAIVAKPAGLLSVPGKGRLLRESVATRLAARFGAAHVVHRLDLETSGVLLVAKHESTHAALQRLFACREIEKRYVAVLDGTVVGERGVIELPLRVDLDDRPRQIVDPIHGKPAVSAWRVLSRSATATRVELIPHTGRTHQLRVHAAHMRGLGSPVCGDRLYGRAAARMLLHAESLAFVHPHTKARVEIVLPAPF
jgi:tRNA pseudouridine32 synthase/23S rRNA pseudouridine746 synthase